MWKILKNCKKMDKFYARGRKYEKKEDKNTKIYH